MRIESIETFLADRWLFVRIGTDKGIHGVGESTFFGWPAAAREIARSFGEHLVGKDPRDVERHWLDLYRSASMRGMAIGGALSAIDMALWDIRGKDLGAPVWQLLGGRTRQAVRAMLVLPYGSRDEVCEAARDGVNRGYTAVKLLLFQPEHHQQSQPTRTRDLIARAEAVRETIGWDVELGIELHRNMVPGEAVALVQELERLLPLFIEDPIAPESVMSLARVNTKLRVPLAAGERNVNLWEFREYVQNADVAFVRPDIGVAGGFTHVRKICAMAEAAHVGIIPHAVPSGPIAVAAHVQLGASVANWFLQEHRDQGVEPWTTVVDKTVPLIDGYLQVSDEPGLGIDLNLQGLQSVEAVARPLGAPTRTDGSIAL